MPLHFACILKELEPNNSSKSAVYHKSHYRSRVLCSPVNTIYFDLGIFDERMFSPRVAIIP